MNNFYIFAIVLTVAIFFKNISVASASSNFNADKYFEDMVSKDDATNILGLGVVILKDGEEIYSKFAGLRHINPDKKITRKTRFRVASVSKMFTIFSIMQLVESGKINLDEDAGKYLGLKLRNPNFPDIPITVRMLASHTSSLRDGVKYSLPPQKSVEEILTSDIYDTNMVGEYFQYCNLNYGLLGTIIEKVSGERFDVYQKKYIFQPTGINADYIVGNFSDDEFENLGTLYQKKNRGVWNEFGDWFAQIDDYDKKPDKDTALVQNPYERDSDEMYSLDNYKVGTNATIFSPQGGLRISFDELAICLKMLMNHGEIADKKILCTESVDEIFKTQWTYNKYNGQTFGGVMLNYGLGTYKPVSFFENQHVDFIGHSGEAYGMISGLYLIPGTMNGVIFMINGTAIDPDRDSRSGGQFSNNYIWEEAIMYAVCKILASDTL